MTDTAERITNAAQAKQAIDLFLGPAFDIVVADWTRRMSEIAASSPWETDKIKNLAMAVRAAGEARKQIEAVVADGRLARDERQRADQIASLPAEKRRWAIM